MKAVRLALGGLLMLGCLTAGAIADDFPSDAYYLFKRHGCVTVWCDLTPCLTSKIVKQLKEGIDVAVDCHVNLGIPRHLLGDRQVASQHFMPRLSYRALTGEFTLSDFEDTTTTPTNFASLAGLYDYLRDSIESCLAPLDSLDDEQRYELGLNLTVVALTDFNTVSGEPSSSGPSSPLEFLFRRFLEFTKYGRTEYSTRSRAFSLDELEEIPPP
jgi:hypothetical protein